MKQTIIICVALLSAVAVHAGKPNIVYLMSDDQSTYTMGCYGNPDVQTPHLDRLAADGMAFDNHYNTTAICMASRATVMTGIYHQQVYAIDVAVGMIRRALKDQGVEDNTVIIFTSDNGFFCGSHGYGSKVLPYEESTRVPMIIYDPRHSNSGKQLRSDALTGNIDFAPTILKLAGLSIPEKMDGADLMRLYDDPDEAIHESLALINVWGKAPTHSLGVVTKEMKYIYWGYAPEGFEVTEELYQLRKDPLELTNLAAYPEFSLELQQMRKAYDQHLAHWKAEAVPYNNYQPYGTIFDRNAAWADKEPLHNKPKARRGRK